MKVFAAILASAGLAAAHGYVDTATIGGKEYQFYQPYTDPYMSPAVCHTPLKQVSTYLTFDQPKRVSRPIQGNGPVTDVSLADIQCGGYSEGGVVGSKPAKLEATAAAGSKVNLQWTLWPDSHIGPTITYMARCPDAGKKRNARHGASDLF